MRYETETSIKRTIAESLRRKKQAAKQPFDPAELETAEYQKWIADRVEDARRGRRLLTEQQYADLMVGRDLRLDDHVRYVGPSILQTSPATGKQVLRNHGQTGTINAVARRVSGAVYTFMPDIPKNVLDAAEAMDIEVLQWETADWMLFERVV